MIVASVDRIKKILTGWTIVELDSAKEIATHGNYLVFDRFVPHTNLPFSGDLHFTLYVARKSLKKGKESCYSDLDALMHRLMTQDKEACFIDKIELASVSPRLFIYAIQLRIEGELDGTDGL